jgi:hypothetical protein
MARPKDVGRVDDMGRAYAGSQRQIQSCVNVHSDKFTSAVADALQLPGPLRRGIKWASPLASDSYAEYRDTEFLDVLALGSLAPQLAQFWPERGPCWDGLARLEGGCILIEAKSHVQEIYGGGCGAGESSLVRINAALDQTKQWLGAPAAANWTDKLYQSANRYAHLYFLREKCSIPAYLLNVYFVGDQRTPTSEQRWTEAIREVNSALGLTSPVPFSASLFFDASSLP